MRRKSDQGNVKRLDPPEEERRNYLKTVGALVAGLAIGGAAGWLSKPAERITERITETVTKTVTAPITPMPTPTLTPTPTPKEEITLKVVGTVEAHCYAKKALSDYYYEKTKKGPGPAVRVIVEQFPYDPTHEREVMELSAHSSSYDMICADCFWQAEYKSAGWLWDLEELKEMYPELPEPDIKGVEWSGKVKYYDRYDYNNDGYAELMSVPVDLCIVIMAYRKDLFEAAGIVDEEGKAKPPTTWDEYLEDIKKLTRDDVYGAVFHLGGRDAGYSDWIDRRQGFEFNGREIPDYVFDENYKPIFNDEKGVRALEMLIEHLPYSLGGAEGALGIDYPEAITIFEEGKAATFITWDVLMFEFENPSISKVAGNVGYAPVPYTEKPTYLVGGWHLGINKWSKHPKEAYEYLAWIISEEGQEKMLEAGAPTAYRLEPYQNPKWIEKYPLMACIPKLKNPYPFPRIPEWVEVQRIIYEQIVKAVAGEKTPQKALDDAADEVYSLMEKAGYYK